MVSNISILFSKEKKKLIRDKAYEITAKIVLKYGKKSPKIFTMDTINEFWDLPDISPPSPDYFLRYIKMPYVWWWINNKLTLDDKIWNSDFIHGLAKHGRIKWNKKKSPTLLFTNWNIENVIKHSPLKGDLGLHRWSYVPAFYLKHSKESISFMAGFFSVFLPHQKRGYCYAVASKSVTKLLRQWKIPVEIFGDKYVYISPIWPALLTPWMPESIRNQWMGLKKACKVRLYAPILWKTYVDNHFKKNGIPYLKAERTIYYEFQKDIGALKNLDLLRIETELIEVDNRIGEIVRKWGKNEIFIN